MADEIPPPVAADNHLHQHHSYGAMGNMAVPSIVTLAGTAILVPLSPVLIFGCGPIPPDRAASGFRAYRD